MEEDEVYMDESETNTKSFGQRFGWYIVVNRVAANDITKHDDIFKKTLVEVLNQVSFLIEQDNEIEKQRRKAMNQI
jgi:hypothetical protein